MNEKTPPDFEYNHPAVDSELVWIPRHVDDTDIYFVANQRGRSEEVETKYRIAGMNVGLSRPNSGEIQPAAMVEGGTLVPLHLDPYGSVFVVFHGNAASPSRSSPSKVVLDPGNVKDITEVSVNGKSVEPILWKPAYEADVTSGPETRNQSS